MASSGRQAPSSLQEPARCPLQEALLQPSQEGCLCLHSQWAPSGLRCHLGASRSGLQQRGFSSQLWTLLPGARVPADPVLGRPFLVAFSLCPHMAERVPWCPLFLQGRRSLHEDPSLIMASSNLRCLPSKGSTSKCCHIGLGLPREPARAGHASHEECKCSERLCPGRGTGGRSTSSAALTLGPRDLTEIRDPAVSPAAAWRGRVPSLFAGVAASFVSAPSLPSSCSRGNGMVVCAQVTVLLGCGASCVQVGCGFYPERVHWRGQERGGPRTHIPVGVVGQRGSAHRGLCTRGLCTTLNYIIKCSKNTSAQIPVFHPQSNSQGPECTS